MEFMELVSRRHSVRKYEDRPVERDLLDIMVRVASTAPSSRHSNSSAFMVIEDRDTVSAISEMRDRGASFVKDAPAVIVVLGDESKSDLWVDNCAISATFLQLAATDLGLGSCWVHVNTKYRVSGDPDSGLAEDYLKELLGIRDGMRILCVVSVGYPQE